VVLQLVAIIIFIYTSCRLLTAHNHQQKPLLRSVAILVLGDIGRSPRMMYHAESFARSEFDTFLIGYGGAYLDISPRRVLKWTYRVGSKPIPSLLSIPHIHFLYLSSPPKLFTKLPFIISAPIKIVLQIATVLTALLLYIPLSPEFILVQVRSI
jgi:beta-1,4-mannosyltransferase